MKELGIFIDESDDFGEYDHHSQRKIYANMSVNERRRIFNKMVAFIRRIHIRYKCFYIEKKHTSDVVEAFSTPCFPNPISAK